jgi:hypothetical protein
MSGVSVKPRSASRRMTMGSSGMSSSRTKRATVSRSMRSSSGKVKSIRSSGQGADREAFAVRFPSRERSARTDDVPAIVAIRRIQSVGWLVYLAGGLERGAATDQEDI